MNNYCAVLMDTISIQKYVFASNKLLENLGASQIVENLFGSIAVPSLAFACGIEESEARRIIGEWEKEPEAILMTVEPRVPFEVGVSGGGKALFFFRDPDQAKSFIEDFTRQLLIAAPGLQLAVAVNKDFALEGQDFPQQLSKLFQLLTQNRNRHFVSTDLPHHGLTSVCPHSGASINLWDSKEKEYVSWGTRVKRQAAQEEDDKRNRELEEKHSECIFSNQLDQLGQQEGDSYTAVIHIDGNNMGKWFKQSTDIVDYRRRSISMKQVTKASFWSLIDEVARLLPDLDDKNGFSLKRDKGRSVLPIRSLIIGGDDITFICHAKLALYLAERFLQVWSEKANSDSGLKPLGLPENGEFTACAGIGLARTKYPFYRTYQFAEQSCTIAKKSARREEMDSWIDFQLITGTKSGSLEKIREDEGKSHGINQYFGPYCIKDDHEMSIQGLKSGIQQFVQGKYWAGNKLKELRNAFNLGQEVVDDFVMGMKAQGGSLPAISQLKEEPQYQDYGYNNKQTPYPDILEMMEFYPPFLLKGGE